MGFFRSAVQSCYDWSIISWIWYGIIAYFTHLHVVLLFKDDCSEIHILNQFVSDKVAYELFN